MDELKKIRLSIRDELSCFQKYFKESMKSKAPFLNIILNYMLKRKGKQIRPMYVFLSANALGKTNESTYVAASLIELLHTATLIHDDVVDESFERRGRWSINALWKSKVAVLLGDYLLAKGLLLSVNNRAYELLQVVSRAVEKMSEGELLQIRHSRKAYLSEQQYFDIITKKTAELFSSCTRCGALSVNASEQEVEAMTLFGLNAGIAFQIKDDIFDYQKGIGIGKPAGNDLKERKITLPLIYVLNQSSEKERKKVLKLLNNTINKKTINVIIDYVYDRGGIDYARSKMYEYKQKALDELNKIPDNEYKNYLTMLLNYTVERKR
jgi:octaprenyl-diphosphate synthase